MVSVYNVTKCTACNLQYSDPKSQLMTGAMAWAPLYLRLRDHLDLSSRTVVESWRREGLGGEAKEDEDFDLHGE